MKQFTLLFVTILLSTFLFGQKKFKIFGVKISPKEVVGNASFNDIGVYYPTTVINDLTDDTTTYLWRLGSIRTNYRVYQEGTIPLFNLSTSNHFSGYSLLDSIDFIYFRERGFQIIESKEPSLSLENSFLNFKKYMSDVTKSILERKNYLWLDSNKAYREKILNSRYFVNVQPITLNKAIKKRLTAQINSTLKTDLNDLLKVAVKQKDTTTGQKVDSLAVSAYFTRTLSKTIDLKGIYLSAKFQEEYINTIKYVVGRINSTDEVIKKDDQFNENLLNYVKGQCNSALNSALFAFKFSGSLDKKSYALDSIKSDLQALFNIGAKQAATLATKANLAYSKSVDETFNNQFSKVWIFMFGTDFGLDKLSLHDIKYSCPQKK